MQNSPSLDICMTLNAFSILLALEARPKRPLRTRNVTPCVTAPVQWPVERRTGAGLIILGCSGSA